MTENNDPRDMDPIEAMRWHLFLAQCELNALAELIKGQNNQDP